MDPLSITASALTVASAAFVASKFLYEKVKSFNSNRKDILDLLTDLETLKSILESAESQIRSTDNEAKYEPIKEPLRLCLIVTRELQDMLDDCLKHAKPDHDSVRVWLKMQYRGQSFIDLKKRLASCKANLDLAFNIINLDEHAVTQARLTEMKTRVEGLQLDFQDQYDDLKDTIEAAEGSVKESLQADLDHIQRSLRSLQVSQQHLNETRPQITVQHNEAGAYSSAMFGTNYPNTQGTLNVSNNKAGAGSTVAAGVYSEKALEELLKHRNPHALVLLQAAQAGGGDLGHVVLQSQPRIDTTTPRQASTTQHLIEEAHPPNAALSSQEAVAEEQQIPQN